ncbi:MAG: hypothetical protein ABI591_00180 [Kofleriaceae bacterium]
MSSDDVLDADARSLLDLGRDQLGPDAETIARLRGRVETAVAVAGTVTIAAGIASKLGLTSVKLVILAVTVTTVSTVAVVQVVQVVRRPSHDAARVVTLPATHATRQRPIVVTNEPLVIHEEVASATPEVAPPPESKPAPTRVAKPTPPRPEPAAPAIAVPQHASLARETELVDLATRAMRANDLASLRATLQVYASETGGAGQLAEDIDAIEIEALCRANDPLAATRLAAFDARWPRASQRHRLTAACKGLP